MTWWTQRFSANKLEVSAGVSQAQRLTQIILAAHASEPCVRLCEPLRNWDRIAVRRIRATLNPTLKEVILGEALDHREDAAGLSSKTEST